MANFEPTEADLKGWLARIDRARKRWEAWTNEGRLHTRLYRNEIDAWNEIAPGGGVAEAGSGPTTVVRNVVAENVRSDIRKQVFKHPKFNAAALVSEFFKEIGGKAVPVDVEIAAAAQKECLNYAFHRIRFRETLRMALEDAKLAGEGWIMVTSSAGFDVSEGALWPEEEGGKKSRIGPRGQVTSLAMKSMPGAVWISWEDISFDPDALLDGQMNWVAHKLKKPLAQMKTMTDEETDLATGKTRQVPRYRNLDKLEGGMRDESCEEREKRYAPEDLLSDLPPEEYVWYWEVHCRFPADSKVVRDANGGRTPRTSDGFVKYILTLAVMPGEGGEPVLLRWKPYARDMKGFALKRLVFMRYNRQARGSSIIRDYRDAVAKENYYLSMWASWAAVNFPRVIADESVVKREDVEKAEQAGINAWVFVRASGGRDIGTGIATTPTTPISPELPALVQVFRSAHGDASGRSANQRGQILGVRTAEEVKTVASVASEMLADEIEQIKEFVEDVAEAWMKLFVAELPESGVLEVPNGTGGHLRFNAELLDVPAIFDLDYTSMIREDSELKRKQITEFLAMMTKIPPQMVQALDPFIRRLALAFGPDFEAAYKEYRSTMTKKDPADPDVEHLMIREGQWVEPADEEDFAETLVAHKEMLASVLTDPTFAAWKKVQVAANGREYVPFELLSQHIQMSKKYGQKKGQIPPDAPGSAGVPGQAVSANERGRGMMSGSSSQAVPDQGEMEAGAANVNTEGSGSMRGI